MTKSTFRSDAPFDGPIRIVRIIDRLNIGGPAKHVVWLTAGVDQHQFDTVLITGNVAPGEGEMDYFAHEAGVEPVVIPEMSRELSLRDLLVVAKLFRQFRRFRPQIIHTHKAKAGFVGRIAALLYKWLTPSALWLRPRDCRVVHTFHGHIFHSYYGPVKTLLFLTIERLLARFGADRIITISDQQRREIAGMYRVGRPEQFRVIPLGIDFDECPEQFGKLRAELGIAAEELLIGIVGRLCEVKNHALLLEAAARLVLGENEYAPHVHFVIIGDGHLREELEQQAHRLGIADRVTFTGFRQDVMGLYGDLDVVALTSLNEGTPLTLIEAMNSGCPVVATEVGGVVDLLGARAESTAEDFSVWEHGVTAPSRDAAGFANALRFMIDRPELRSQMGERGRAFVRTHLSRERLVQDVEALYRELIVGPAIGPATACDVITISQSRQPSNTKLKKSYYET